MRTLLIADDDEDIRTVFRLRLERQYRILEAASGDAVLQLVRTEPPDLVILDLSMPGICGSELLEKVRAEPAMVSVPVVILTGRSDQSERGRLQDLGVVAFLLKPVAPGQLEGVIRQALEPQS